MIIILDRLSIRKVERKKIWSRCFWVLLERPLTGGLVFLALKMQAEPGGFRIDVNKTARQHHVLPLQSMSRPRDAKRKPRQTLLQVPTAISLSHSSLLLCSQDPQSSHAYAATSRFHQRRANESTLLHRYRATIPHISHPTSHIRPAQFLPSRLLPNSKAPRSGCYPS